MNFHHVELVCDDCMYEGAIGNAGKAAFERLTPDSCPCCDGDLQQSTDTPAGIQVQ